MKNKINGYIEINSKKSLMELYYFINQNKFLNKYKNKRVLFLDKDPNYNNITISKFIFLFSHINKIDLDYYQFKFSNVDYSLNKIIGDGDFNKLDNESNFFFPEYNTGKILNRLIGHSNKINILDKLDKFKEYDLVICNTRGFSDDFKDIICEIKYKNIFYFLKGDGGGLFLQYPYFLDNKDYLKKLNELCLNDALKFQNKNISFDMFQSGGYSFFPKTFSKMYEINHINNYKYDLVMSGSVRTRDYLGLKKILKNLNLNILIVVATQHDKNIIKNIFGQDIKYTITQNTLSYSNMYKLMKLAKVYINYPIKGRFSTGMDGLLIPLSSKTIVFTYKTPFYKKILKDGYDGFLYSSDNELMDKLIRVLKMKEEELNIIRNNRYLSYLKTKQIEDVLSSTVFPKLLK